MPETEDNAVNGLVVRSKLPLSERLRDSSAIWMFVLLCFILGAVAGFVSVRLHLGYSLVAMFGYFCVGVAMAAASVVALSGATKLAAKKRIKLTELQEKLAESGSDDICRDLDVLIKGHMALKEFDVADHFSNKLLELSALPVEQRTPKLLDVMQTTQCWVSTPLYHKKLNYYLLWLFESRGTLTMTGKRLRYKSKRIGFDIDLADLRDVSIGHHPRWMKPIPFKYLILTFVDEGREQKVFVTPSLSQADTIWEANKLTDRWHQKLLQARERRVGARAIEKMRSNLPGLGSESEQTVGEQQR